MAISRSLKDGGYKGAMGLFHEVDEQRTAENQRELLALKCHSMIFASVIGVITLLQAYVFTGMLVS
ncbi:hypothetical protein E2K61_25080 [Escherichia coli]|nr:hypothetical protein E2K61_25080 [Escherichia coli]